MKYRNFEIIVSVAICRKGTQNIITEAATMREAKKISKENGYRDVDYWIFSGRNH